VFEAMAVCSSNPIFEFVAPLNSFTPVNICGDAVVPPANSASPVPPPPLLVESFIPLMLRAFIVNI
jgi:hypothetical protein